MCWVMSNAGTIQSPSLPPSVSLFQKEKLGMEILTLARRINHLLYSIQQLSNSHETYRPKRIQELFFLFVIFFFLPCVHTCLCVGNYKRNWNVKNSKKLLESPSPILLPLIIRDVSFQTFLSTYIIFKKWGGKLFCSYSEACFLFFGQQYMAIYPCVNIQTQVILFHCSAIFHDTNVPWLISLLPLQYF